MKKSIISKLLRLNLALFFVLITSVAYPQNQVDFLFVGHCYQIGSGGTRVDYRLEQLDLSVYEGVWLGGDVCSEAMLNYSTIQYIDSLVDLGNYETHWALGNHDARNGNWEWYNEFTGRDTYYAYNNYGITRIVLNTNLVPTNCEMMNDQFEMISYVCDTIQQSKYLILLMHHGLWRDVPELPPPSSYAHSDLRFWNANCDSVNTNFVDVVYPKLVEVKQRGIEVICIMGDMGAGTKKFQMDSDDGVHFLGCGLNNNDSNDVVLIFHHITATQQLEYDFHNLDSLYNAR
ncbi:MAG: metallophosphoesterase [Bacteroidetes bacterium]|nr:metallophosphoesterase [Bacteroidota bacterium]MBL6944251.1 metallophosphoesterase [Bacteroidales bacterium]